LQVWGDKKRPVLWMERQIRNMNYTLETYGNGIKYNENYLENEYALEEAFSSSATLSQLISYFFIGMCRKINIMRFLPVSEHSLYKKGDNAALAGKPVQKCCIKKLRLHKDVY